jgi:hypothetical protein
VRRPSSLKPGSIPINFLPRSNSSELIFCLRHL